MSSILNINKLSKSYGKVKALDNLSLEIEQGKVYGILGPNGSGKTTTLGIVLSVLKADTGSFTWFNEKPSKHHRKNIGSLLETPNFYAYLTARQNLMIACQVKNIPETEVDRVLEIVNLIERANSKFKTFSLGMKQRLALASALLGDPEVLVLDEPTNGLDPQGIAEVRNIIKKIANEGKTIVLASHVLDEVEKICTDVAVLKMGKLIASGSINSILTGKDQVFVAAENTETLRLTLEQIPEIINLKQDGNRFYMNLKDDYNTSLLNKTLFEKNIIVSELGKQKTNLEANFLKLVK